MKKAVAAVAITASSSAMGLIAPGTGAKTKTICLRGFATQTKLMYASSCDESRNNKLLRRPLLKNGCAKGQIALRSAMQRSGKWSPQVSSCMRPNVAQL